MRSTKQTPVYRLFHVLLIACFCLQLYVLVLSLRQWAIAKDGSSMAYVADQVIRGARPYVDVYDNNLPGPYLFTAGLVLLFGNTNFAFRIVDLCILAVVCSLIYRLSNSFFRSVRNSQSIGTVGITGYPVLPRGYIAVVFFLGFFLFEGTYFTLQRDSYIQVFVLFAVWTAHHKSQYRASLNGRALLIGLLMGCAVIVKPNIVIFAPLIWGWFIYRNGFVQSRSWRQIVSVLVTSGIGGLIPIGVCLLWLIQQGSLDEFIRIFRTTTPLYAGLNWDGERTSYLHIILFWTTEIYAQLLLFFLTGVGILIFCILVGLLTRSKRVNLDPSYLQSVLFWALFTLTGFLYVFLARKFFDYHWFPMVIGMAVFAAILPFPDFSARRHTLPLTVINLTLWGLIFARIGVIGTLYSYVGTTRFPRYGATEAFSEAQPMIACIDYYSTSGNDRAPVQLLGNTSATPDLALRLSHPMATRFYYDTQFYLLQDDPQVQLLRNELLDNLQADPPLWIIDTELSWPQNYAERTRLFPALYEFISTRYERVNCEGVTSRPVYPLYLFRLR